MLSAWLEHYPLSGFELWYETRDIAFVFFVLAIGMGIGAGNPLISVVATFTICLIVLGLNFLLLYSESGGKQKIIKQQKRVYPFFQRVSSQETQSNYLSVFSRCLSNYHQLEQRLTKSGKIERTFTFV